MEPPMPGAQEYHTHERNPVSVPTSTLAAILHDVEIEIEVHPDIVNDGRDLGLHAAIKHVALRHGIKLK